ncbi:MAG: LolA family protein [Pyrinomonadaceae bacterium]
MNRVLRFGILAICLGFIFSTVSVRETNAQNILGEILRRMDNYNKSLQSLKADVTMVKHNPQLKVSDTLAGTTSFLPNTKNGRYIRLDWKTENGRPKEESISVMGDKYELYSQHRNTVIQGTIQKAQNSASIGNALSFMSMSTAQRKASYDPVYIGEEQIQGGFKTWHVQLTPKTATSYKLADLWIDVDGVPRQAKITERNNDTTTVLLSNIQKNITIKANIFKLKYPSSVKKVKG